MLDAFIPGAMYGILRRQGTSSRQPLCTCALEDGQFKLIRTFKWADVDLLNHAALSIKAEAMGAKFRTHDKRQAYHHAYTIDLINDVAGKLLNRLDYPTEVAKGQGLTFASFMKKMKRMQAATLGMTASETSCMLKLIDHFVRDGYLAAADNTRTVIYGANPAEKELGAWIPESAPVLVKLTSALSKLKKVDEMRVGLPDVFGSQPTARTLPWFASSSTAMAHGDEGEDTSAKKRRKRQRGGKKQETKSETEPTPKFSRLGREERLKENPKKVFHYNDVKFSAGRFLFDCGRQSASTSAGFLVVSMTYAYDANRDREYACMNSQHK